MANKVLSEPLPPDVLMAHDEVFFSGPPQDKLDPFSVVPFAVHSTPHSLPSTSSDPQSVPVFAEDEWCKYPGTHNFSVEFASATSKRKSWYYSEDTNTLFIKNETNFAVLFHMDQPIQPNLSVRVMVCYSNSDQVRQHCPVLPCSCNNHVNSRNQIYGDRFIITTAKSAKYSETKKGHKTVTVDLKNAPPMNGSYFAVYSYASYTSCLAKKNRVATIFSLMDGDKEVGRDVFYCRVCACPVRDQARLEKRRVEEGPQPKRRKFKSESERLPFPLPAITASSPPTNAASPSRLAISPGLLYHDPDMDMSPDQEGYYTFTWKLKDQELFHRLCEFKKHSILIQRAQHLVH